MALLALGLNHHTAPVEIREKAAIGDTLLGDALRELQGVDAVNEAAIVSTCNRTEVYCGLSDPHTTAVNDWLISHLALAPAEADRYLFQHSDQAVVRHLMRVCSGLDSLIVGEPQILGQMKRAFRDAHQVGTVGGELSALFQSAFSVAKQVRTETAIGNSAVSVAFAAVGLARQIFADLSARKALLIGAGDTVQLAARHLATAGIGHIRIANRTVQNAAGLAEEIGGSALSLTEIPDVLSDADIIITSTGSPLPILGKGAVEKALKARRFRPMLIIDIAVPRDVESEVGSLDSVFLYTVDDLHSVIEENRQSREAAAREAEKIVVQQVSEFMRRRQSLDANDTIRAYRESVEDLRSELVDRALLQLQNGQDAERVIQHLAHNLGNKLMHAPTTRLRKAAEEGDIALLDAARVLLDPDTTRR